jgi:hypothetical protein
MRYFKSFLNRVSTAFIIPFIYNVDLYFALYVLFYAYRTKAYNAWYYIFKKKKGGGGSVTAAEKSLPEI